MATLAEVEEAVGIIRDAGNNQVILLQCTTNYPSRPQDANLRAMQTMQATLDTLVGYSDHTKTETACVAAVALGACVIEKHFTLDKTMRGPDQSSSADPDEFLRLVELIRETEMVLGSGVKAPVEVERRNAVSMRRSLVSKAPIPAGTVISEEMLCYKRPGNGIPPTMLNDVVGCVTTRDIPPDTIVLHEWLRREKK
jgi:N-acetylneuraminate synthase/N,N'-diacetyllegionaminate synthase